MATRSIVTSQPDVACDVCGRRLLRGESPDTFLDGGRERRTVCELCAPRAAQEGWRRESESEALELRPPRGRRGVSLLDRIRQLREPVQSTRRIERTERIEGSEGGFHLGSVRAAHGPESPLDDEAIELPQAPLTSEEVLGEPLGDVDARLAYVLEVFNRGEQPRRVAGVARSLGAPSVSAQPVLGSDSRFTIVVAWELCWYRYEVDLDDEMAGATMVQKGMELDELPLEHRLDNAVADEQGELHLVG